ncbi:hypothetical protein P7D22_11890 [Lichenihabitans sp. Uapishka_5]|uniref:hypothetical protein n=1 Tax=Lichenihabitans sp. Uapishka_5 TaxID=3037302 RepID=UPI0029E81F8F|nr:hypothetical protein [Lichenihabitans sp. Uapishka_5]MDX7951871.1 hypothetical protein [Lichenihabitans sp. Uapishka_5]
MLHRRRLLVRFWRLLPPRKPRRIGRGLLVLAAAVTTAGPASAVSKGGPGWHDRKCDLYRAAWTQAIERRGSAGLSSGFLAAHAAFLASRCTRRADVCARSPEELDLANAMVVLSMNFGAASTMAPFYCRP